MIDIQLMKYSGTELEIFEKASNFRKYSYLLVKKFIGTKILEVGAGIGSFTNTYIKNNSNITVNDADDFNFESLKRRFNTKKNVKVEKKNINQLNDTYDTIMYMSVLEHIKDDKSEISNALDKLDHKGNLIILVPAHHGLYSNFDKEIGHFRRYEMNFFKNLNFNNAKVKKTFYVDSLGYVLYYLNKIIFKKNIYPTNFQVLLWDKIFVPLAMIFDFLTLYKFGKNIICVIEKNNI